MSEKVEFRAHARLLTMLGEQLIKNDRIALVELVKNSYDADATKVLVDFRGFDANFTPGPAAAIVITDNGVGMTQGLVRTAWMNPATPSKALVKKDEPTTTRGRVLQGEKGIGRFATFKLGSEVEVVTRARGRAEETTLVVDISNLDASKPEGRRDLEVEYFLEDVPALIDIADPVVFTGGGTIASEHGTRLTISSLRSSWNARLVSAAFEDLDRLQPLMWIASEEDEEGSEQPTVPATPDFEVVFLRNGIDLHYANRRSQDFEAVRERAVLRVRNGRFDQAGRMLSFELNGRAVELDIDDAEVRSQKPFRDWFLKDEDGNDLPPSTLAMPVCGDFGFEFFVFDITPQAPPSTALDSAEVRLVKSHRIYLYRDGIRVYPYGDVDDDWLEIDVDRGVESAGRTLSNDQTVGYVTITQADNPNLRDKTSREGLLESGLATGDFKALIKTVLRYLRTKPYKQYADANRRARERNLKQHRIDRHIEAIRKDPELSAKAHKQLDDLEAALGAERELSAMQLGRTEQLAGVGLSVETASHDLILAGTEGLRLAKQIVSEMRLLDLTREPVFEIATSLVTRLEFVTARFKDVQGLFVSTRQKQTNQDVIQILRRVRSIYGRLHDESGIEFEIDADSALRAPSTEAAVLQLLINLVDNATHWLLASPHEPRIMRAFTPDPQTLVFTDSGPGVKEQDADFIFEAFYSGKGDEGKGLGLYIARQNGSRNGYSIDLERTGDPRELMGATFVVKFGQ
jgi:signal transduction histidine kinase